ncbi:putative glucan endo-1,3-beta-D-glucosidase [Helianthus debilis subsp. tardiflorus]
MASSRENAREWMKRNVRNHSSDIISHYITTGNEVKPLDTTLTRLVHPGLTNVHESIVFHGHNDQVEVSVAVDTTLIGLSFPTPQGTFNGDTRPYMDPIIGFLVDINAPLLLNIYRYFRYISLIISMVIN